MWIHPLLLMSRYLLILLAATCSSSAEAFCPRHRWHLGPRAAPSLSTIARQAAPQPLVVLENEDVKAGSRTLVEGLNLTVRGGERLAIVGVNGAGKSVLAQFLAKRVVADGLEDGDPTDSAAEVGSLAQRRVLSRQELAAGFEENVLDPHPGVLGPRWQASSRTNCSRGSQLKAGRRGQGTSGRRRRRVCARHWRFRH